MPRFPAAKNAFGATTLGVSALMLAAFPLVRPFADRSPDPLDVAGAYASPAWVLAHALAGLAFILLPIGLLTVCAFLRGCPGERRAFLGLVFCWLGVGLIVPTVLGTEAFGLRAIGQAALRQQNTDVLLLARTIRAGPQAAVFFPGLLVLAAGAVLMALAVWSSGALPKWSGVLVAAGLALFFPLFPQSIRIIDGLLTGAGGTWMALRILRSGASAGNPAADKPTTAGRWGSAKSGYCDF